MGFLWLTAALSIILTLYLLTLLMHMPPGTSRHTVRPRMDRGLHRRIRRLLRLPPFSRSLKTLQQKAPLLLEHLHHLRKDCRHLPPLPASEEHEPRLMDLARDIADGDAFDAQTLLHALTEGDIQDLRTPEVRAFPYLVAIALCQRFSTVIKALTADTKDYHTALVLARRLRRGASADLLADSKLNSVGFAILLNDLREAGQPPLLARINDYLDSQTLSADSLSESWEARQSLLTDEIHRTINCLDALEQLDWDAHCHEAEPLHALLCADPAGVYPRMNRSSQLQLRLQASRLSLAAHLPETTIVQESLTLSTSSDSQSQERYIGYWLSVPQGLASLHRCLGTKQGYLYFRLISCREGLERVFLWSFGVTVGIVFLQAGQPVFMLPFFLIAVGCISRFILHKIPPDPLPRISLADSAPHIRSLVVLHASVENPQDCRHAVQQLRSLRKTFDTSSADFLLMPSFPPCITAVSGLDGELIRAISDALQSSAPEDNLLYLQRGRTWNSSMHLYSDPGGICGALMDICRLIAKGETDTPIGYSNLPLKTFERKYAYVLSLPENAHPSPDLLAHMLQIIAHPLCLRYPDAHRPRGYSVLLPEETPLFIGAGLLRPDAFLEATDGLIFHADSLMLSGILAGQATVTDAHIHLSQQASPWADAYQRSITAWKHFLWQLPWIQTPAGLITNPLHAGGRFLLRELLRETLIPFGQFVLLLWALLTQSWPLFLLSLTAPELPYFQASSPFLRWAANLSLLPTRMTVSLSAVIQLLRRKSARPPDWQSLMLWSQLLAATLMGSLGFVPVGFTLPCLVLCGLFCVFPLSAKHLDPTA